MFVITASNMSNLAEDSEYAVKVFIAGHYSNKMLWEGHLAHKRSDGWEKLVSIINDAVNQKGITDK